MDSADIFDGTDGFDRPYRPGPSALVTAAGVDHVRLSYEYLDTGDTEGYGSLLDDDVVCSRPGAVVARGRRDVTRAHVEMARAPWGRHHTQKVIAEGDSVVVVGRLQPWGIDFVDVFTLSRESLLLDRRRYFFAVPQQGAGTA